MPVFQDTKEPVFFVPEGDYIFCVVEFTKKYSQGAATAGAEQYELKCECEGKGSWFFDTLTVHEKTLWRLEAFLRATGNALKAGQPWSFSRDEAESIGGVYINPVGIRGYAHLIVGQYPAVTGPKKNKVGAYLALDAKRPKLPPRVIEVAEDDVPF